ncbi:MULTISPECIES: AAA family ATPase [Giesbergeria]|uniref:AAA family ATPase n=1 Tax=Giesbergeria sinuosa TaxID=80883 RepID=A0ABV9QGY3_9BURK
MNNRDYSPEIILSFFGLVGVICENKKTAIKFKYKKSVAILAFLAYQPGRLVSRDALARYFWPHQDASSAKANLRVVISDITKTWQSIGLPPAIQIDRENVAFIPLGKVASDFFVLKSIFHGETKKSSNLVQVLMRDAMEESWLAGFDDVVSEDFNDWISLRRKAIDEFIVVAQKNNLNDIDSAARWVNLSAHYEFNEVATLGLLRIERNEFEVFHQQQNKDPEEVILEVQKILRSLGGEIIETDDIGCTIIFGHLDVHTGARRQILQAVAILWQRFGDILPLRMGATAGKVHVFFSKGQWRIQGWRTRLVYRLALYADVGQFVCCKSFSDILHDKEKPAKGPIRFRGIKHDFMLHVMNLHSFRANFPPVSVPFSGFVGHSKLLEVADQKICHAMQGECQSISIIGNDGFGKSRSAWEIAHRAQKAGLHVWWFAGKPESQHTRGQGLREMLFISALEHSVCGNIAGGLHFLMAQAGEFLEEKHRQIITKFIELEEVDSSALMESMLIFASFLSLQKKAICFVVDDWDWLDDVTKSVVSKISSCMQGSLLVSTRRTNNTTSKPLIDAYRHSNHYDYIMSPLGESDAFEIINALNKNGDEDSKKIKGKILNSRGIPLYLIADFWGEDQLHPHFAEYCNATLNRMQSSKLALQFAAMQGMSFQYQNLVFLCGELKAAQVIDLGKSAGFLLDRGNGYFAFHHPLVRDYVLSTLSASDFLDHAKQCAELLQSQENYTAAADIWLQAKNIEMARHCWLMAAQGALKQDDISTACSYFEKISQIGYGADAEGMRARAQHVRCLIALQGYGSRQAHRLTRIICQNIAHLPEHPDVAFDALFLSYLHASAQSNTKGKAHALRMVHRATDAESYHTVCWAMINSSFWLGQRDEARVWFKHLLGSGQRLSAERRRRYFLSDPLVMGCCQMACLEWLHGNWDLSMQALHEAERYAQASSTRQDRAIFHAMAGLLNWLGGQSGLAHAQQSAHIANTEGLSLWGSFASLLCMLEQPVHAPNLEWTHITHQVDALLKACPAAEPIAKWLAAEALVLCGNFEMALRLADQSLQTMVGNTDAMWQMELMRVKALALRSMNQHGTACKTLKQALMQGHHMKGWLYHRGRLD